jgi:hypothetical protein
MMLFHNYDLYIILNPTTTSETTTITESSSCSFETIPLRLILSYMENGKQNLFQNPFSVFTESENET